MQTGRPTDYRPEYVAQVFKLALLGLTDVEMAGVFGVAESTFHKWKKDHPEFSESLNSGKEDADADVVVKLRERAMGYEHEDVDIRVVEGQIVKTPIIKKYPPDPTSAIFWLKNRQSGKWRDKQVVEATVTHLGEVLAQIDGSSLGVVKQPKTGGSDSE